jgi:hypothetical protein
VAVETYVLELGKSKAPLKSQALSVLCFAVVYFSVMLAFNHFWPSPYGAQESVYRIAFKVVFISLFWGVAMSVVQRKIPSGKLVVNDQSMSFSMEYPEWWKWRKFHKTVSAGKVRSIRETNGRFGGPGGLVASERTGFSAWMYGGIFIPQTLPQYERLKTLVESWRAPGTAA